MWCAQDHISRSIPHNPLAAPPDSRVTRDSQVRISPDPPRSSIHPAAAVATRTSATAAIPTPKTTNWEVVGLRSWGTDKPVTAVASIAHGHTHPTTAPNPAAAAGANRPTPPGVATNTMMATRHWPPPTR